MTFRNLLLLSKPRPIQNQPYWLVLLGILILTQIGIIPYIADPIVEKFFYIHFTISVVLVLVFSTLWPLRRGSFKKIFLAWTTLTILYPFINTIAYPYRLINLTLVVLIVTIFISLPFASPRLTWFVYTLGGIVPLPKDAKWLERFVSQKMLFPSLKYEKFVRITLIAGVSVGLAIGYSSAFNDSTRLLIFRVLAIPLSFAYLITLGMTLRDIVGRKNGDKSKQETVKGDEETADEAKQKLEAAGAQVELK